MTPIYRDQIAGIPGLDGIIGAGVMTGGGGGVPLFFPSIGGTNRAADNWTLNNEAVQYLRGYAGVGDVSAAYILSVLAGAPNAQLAAIPGTPFMQTGNPAQLVAAAMNQAAAPPATPGGLPANALLLGLLAWGVSRGRRR